MADQQIIEAALLSPLGAKPGDLFVNGAPIVMVTNLTSASAAGVAATGSSGPQALAFNDRDANISDAARLLNGMAALVVNATAVPGSYAALFESINTLTAQIEGQVKVYLDQILHDPEFQKLEANWQGLDDLSGGVISDDVIIDFLDVSKDELASDLADNDLDIFGGDLFHKVYTEEYDSYGGRPFGAMIGLYEFDSQEADINWLHYMTKICAAAHCPFIASVNPAFFRVGTIGEVASITDLDAVMNHPKAGKWNELRDEDWAAYIGLTLPRYIVRAPWDASDNAQASRNLLFNTIGYVEIDGVEQRDAAVRNQKFLWGNASLLFARNIVRSYESSGWAQHIRGPIGGGMMEGLTAYTFTGPDGKEELQPPIEITIPDYREYQFARNGLIALVNKKNEATATFFSATSIKKPKTFVEDLATKNAFLVTNLSYTFSITIIAHYVKVMMREYIGSTADATYIQQYLAGWLGGYVTTVTNPDDLTLLYYPFKATSVDVQPKPGPFGWYTATISILPHQQFEGMDVELRLEAELGAKT